jgi:nucleotide-binding universal stress UspA family protein
MVQSILCAADGSKIADRAVDFAIGLAKQTGASLTILTVERVSRSTAARSPFWDSTVLDAADAIVRAEFRSAQKKAAAAGLKGLRCDGLPRPSRLAAPCAGLDRRGGGGGGVLPCHHRQVAPAAEGRARPWTSTPRPSSRWSRRG